MITFIDWKVQDILGYLTDNWAPLKPGEKVNPLPEMPIAPIDTSRATPKMPVEELGYLLI
jgi:hypothetical protein